MSHRQEKSRVHGRRAGSSTGGLITAGVLAGVVSVPALAGPSGEQVVHGTARFDRNGNRTTITTSDRAIINYDSFNLNNRESVRFIQPGSSSSVLNRIQNGLPTSIDGSIFANGNVYFVNRAGIYFGQNAVVNVGGIYAAAGNISNQDFLNSVNRFTDLSGEVVNKGEIHATREAHLVGRRVANFGSVVAPDGMITMTAGEDVLIGQRGERVFARIKGDVSNGGAVGVENHGVIDAGSGQVIAGVGDHFALALYDTSVIRGKSVRVAGGAQSTVKVSGDIDASSDAGRGGSIDVLGGRIGLYGADLDASGAAGGGQIHVGGDYQGVGNRLRSEVTLVDGGTTLSVDSALSGNAGRAIVWSDGATVFRGHISGRSGGEGGFAEVSSLGYLDFNGSFDLRGAVKNGTILLDPKNIIVTATDQGGAMAVGDVDDFVIDPSATSMIHDDLLSSWLNGGVAGDVMLKANNDIVFNAGTVVTQNAGETNSLLMFAGRRIVFGVDSTLTLGGGSLTAVANAVTEPGFVASERDAGMGSIIFSLGSDVRVTGAGQSASFSIVDGAGTPGMIVANGHVSAPTLSFTALDPSSEMLVSEDGDLATDLFGLGSDLTITTGGRLRFAGNTGAWSFGSLDATASQIRFAHASGVTATGGSLSFAGGGLFSDTTGQFAFTGPVSLETGYTAAGSALFNGTLETDSDISVASGATFADRVTLSDDVTVALTGAGELVFQDEVRGSGRDLTVDLAGNGGVAFEGMIGFGGNLGDIEISGLGAGDTASFGAFTQANSLTSLSGSGTVSFENGNAFFMLGNGVSHAFDIDADLTVLAGNLQALNGSVRNLGAMTVTGNHTISMNGANTTMQIGSVLLDASGGLSRLNLTANNGGSIELAKAFTDAVRRDTSGLNTARLNITSSGGDVVLGRVLANGADSNVLDSLMINAGSSDVGYVGDRYAARTMTLNADEHHLAAQDTLFGDAFGVTTVTSSIDFQGGAVVVNPGRTFEASALAMGGDVTLHSARASGDGATITLRAADLATLGDGAGVGSNGQRFARVDVISGNVDISDAIFADVMLLDPISDSLHFGATGGGMSVDAGELAVLSTGSIGTLNLGIDNPAGFASYAGFTRLGTGDLGGVDRLNVFGATTVTGDFGFQGVSLNLYGATEMLSGTSIASGSGAEIRFFRPLTVGMDTMVSTANGLISFVNDHPVNESEIGASIDSISTEGGDIAGGGSLMLDAGELGTITLYNVGSNSQLASLTATGGTIDFRGREYNAVDQLYTADTFGIMGDGPGLAGGIVLFADFDGGTMLSNVTFADLNGGMDASVQIHAGVTLLAAVDNLFHSEAEIIGVGGVPSTTLGDLGTGGQILDVGAGEIRLDRNVGRAANEFRLDRVALTSNTIGVDSVFTRGNQTYLLLDDATAGTLTLNGSSYVTSGASTIAINGYGDDSVQLNLPGELITLATGNGGTINLNIGSIDGGGSSLAADAGIDGTIRFASGIKIENAGQSYFAGAMNFLGDAELRSAEDDADITFQGGVVDLGGELSLVANGDDAGVSFTNQSIMLNGFNLNAAATGENGDVTLTDIVAAGGESVTVSAEGAAVLNAIGGAGVERLDIRANTLAINDTAMANRVVLLTNGDRVITVGDDIGTDRLNISNATLANLMGIEGGANTLRIGSAGYAGQILISGAQINRDVAFTTGGGLIRVSGGGLTGVGGLTSMTLTGPEIQLGGAITSEAGLFDLALIGAVNVFGATTIATNGGDAVFGGPINGLADGIGSLMVDTAGGALITREDLGPIGGDRALASLTLVGAPTLRLAGATTTGDQFYNAGEGGVVLLDGSVFTTEIGTIAFGTGLTSLGDAQLVSGPAGGVGLLGVSGDSLSLDGGTILLGGDIDLTGAFALLGGQAILTGDRVISAQMISLQGDIDSGDGAASLTLENAIDTLIAGRLGGNAALASFTSSDQGTTTLSGGVFTDGLSLFRNDVLVAGDALVQSFGANGDAGIRFLGTIDGETAGADSLTLIVDRSLGGLITDPVTGDLVPDPSVPVIALYGDVGTGVELGTLGLNFGADVNGDLVDGRAGVPANATIVLGDQEAFLADGTTTDIDLNVGELLMGFREKMAVLGSLNATGDTARLGDISTVGDMIVDFDGVTILLREDADVFDPTSGLVIADNGVDFVSGGDIEFGTIVALEGTGSNPEFALPGGDAGVESSAGAFLFQSLDTPVSDLIASGATIIDVRADGPTNTNVSEALAGAVPQEEQAEPVVTDVPLSQVALDALIDLGIVIKQPQDNLYLIDLPEDIADASDSTRVSRRRLEPTLVGALVDDYNSALKERAPVTAGEGAAMENVGGEAATGSVVRRDAEVKAILDDAWRAFDASRETAGSADEFVAYLRANSGEQAGALAEIERLQEVVASARVLGLTEREIAAVKSKMIKMMQPVMGSRVFSELIDSSPAALMSVR